MFLDHPKQGLELDGIAIREGVQPVGPVSPYVHSSNLIIQHLLNSANLRFTKAGVTYSRRVVPGDIHIIPAGTEVAFDFLGRADLFLLAFDQQTRLISEDLQPDVGSQLSFQFTLRDAQVSSFVQALREELRSRCVRGRSYAAQLSSTLIRYVVATYSIASRIGAKTEGGLPPNRLRFVLDHIHSNIQARLQSRDLARLVQMSPQHFGNLFRQSTGRAPYEYVIYHRIECGKRLLSETNMPIMEIALEVGFAHHSHFADTFRHVTGMTPKQYRLLYESYPSAESGRRAA